jgi:hypothetical protein
MYTIKISVIFSFIFSFYLAIVILANLIKIFLFEVFVFSLTVGTYVRTNLRLRLVFPLPSAPLTESFNLNTCRRNLVDKQ